MRKLWQSRRLYRFKQDLRVMRRIFPWRTTAVLISTIAVMARLFQIIYRHDMNEPLNYVQAVYAVVNMIFFQLAYTDLPDDPNLAPFFVLSPIIGLSLFSLAGFNILHVLRVFFVRRERGQRWQEALAATHRDHVVVCGLGSVGYRVTRYLAEFDQSVVGVELTRTELADELIDADIPVILGNVRSYDVLEQAGAARAKTVVVCTNQDMANIEAAFHVRELNPQARLILRIFEDEIAQSVQDSFAVDSVLSRSAIAAPAFAHAAVGVEVLENFQLDEIGYVLARVPLAEGATLAGSALGQVTKDLDISVVFLCRDGRLINEPLLDTALCAGDELFVFAATERLTDLVHLSLPASAAPSHHVIVCGLGHVGYRIVEILQTMGYAVTALELESSYLGQRLTSQGVTVRAADFRRRAVLREAGVENALTVVTCTDDDMLNLETSLRARELNPHIRVVMRIFEQELGRRLSRAFAIEKVYSTSALAAPAFVQLALHRYLPQSAPIGDQDWLLARLTIERYSSLSGKTIAELNAEPDLTLVLHAHSHQIDVPPNPESELRLADEIVVLVSQQGLRRLNEWNCSPGPIQQI